MSPDAVEILTDVLEQGGDVDDALRAAVRILSEQPGVEWAAIRFVEDGELVLGPSAGRPDETRRTATPIVYEGDAVGELLVDGEVEPETLARLAEMIGPHVLLGWDTGGATWDP